MNSTQQKPRWSLTRVASALQHAAEARWEAEGFDSAIAAPDGLNEGYHHRAGVKEARAILSAAGWTAEEFLEELDARTTPRWRHFYFAGEFVEALAEPEGPSDV